MNTGNTLEPIAIIGGGRAGCSIACGLALAGLAPRLCVRGPERRAAVQTWLGGLALPRPVQVLGDLAQVARARTLLLAVPDRALADVTAILSETLGERAKGQTWLHLSGVQPAAVLEVPGAAIHAGSLHPLCALIDPVSARLDADAATAPLRNALFALDGDAAAYKVAQTLAEALGGRPLPVPPAARPAYHAAAALVANDLVALIALAAALGQGAGLPEKPMRDGLLHLARTSLAALARLRDDQPLAHGLTGAVVRGDADTLQRHLDALADQPDARTVHVLLSRRLLQLVENASILPDERIAAVRAVLSD